MINNCNTTAGNIHMTVSNAIKDDIFFTGYAMISLKVHNLLGLTHVRQSVPYSSMFEPQSPVRLTYAGSPY